MTTILKRERLGEILREIQEPYLIGLVTKTVPQMAKKNNPYYGHIEKLSKFVGNLTFNYERVVNNRRIKESDPNIPKEEVPVFTALDRAWGTKSSVVSPAVLFKGRTYLEVLVGRVNSTQYLYDGKPISDQEKLAAVLKFIKKKNSEARQQLEKPAILRDYKLSSIVELHTGGETFILED